MTDKPTNWIEVLEQQAQLRPNQAAFTTVSTAQPSQQQRQRQRQRQTISYLALSRQVKLLAVELNKQTRFGDRVLIAIPSSIDYIIGFFACIYANVIGVTAYPPNNKKRDWSRLDAIAQDCDPSVVLHNSAQKKQIKDWLADKDMLIGPLDIDTDLSKNANKWSQPMIDGDDIAYFQYSSGSTGNPKGVMLSHKNLLSNTRLIQQNYQVTSQDKFINWLPFYHDMGFVGGILAPILSGAQTWIMASASVAQQPFTLLKQITDIKATITAGPNFIFDLALSKISDQQKALLDLSSLRVFVNGAEPINAQTLIRFKQDFASTGLSANALKPSYGMAEACLFVTATTVNQPFKLLSLDKQKMSLGKVVASNNNAIEVASSGQINPAINVKIVHQRSRALLSDGNIGEIMIQGDSISRGYWQKPHINQAIFDNTLDGQNGYMATGDLGFIKEGHLYISGRCKEMFIINGRNYYPQDIEHSLSEFSEYIASHGAAIFEVALDDHQNELVLVQELSRKGFIQKDHQSLIKQVIAQISQSHQLKLSAVILIRPMTLPKTTSGKIQRIACRTAYLQGQLKTVASWHRPVQNTICDQISINGQSDEQDIKLWIINWVAQRLNLAATGLCATQHLAQMGLDSIDAMTLTHELSNQLNHQLSVDLAWSYPTIESLSAYLANPNDKTATVTSTPLQGMI